MGRINCSILAICIFFLGCYNKVKRGSVIQPPVRSGAKELDSTALPPGILVNIRCTHVGASIKVQVLPSLNVHQLKSFILEKTGVSVEKQRMFFKGVELENTKTLYDYEITHGSIIEMIQV
jgi:hypothetical protein